MEATCKLGSKGCWNDGKCRATSNCENKVVTNADLIRAMSDEELAKLCGRNSLCEHIQETDSEFCANRDSCGNGCIVDWLQQPAKNPVEWSKPGPCPVIPEQFDAIYNDEEEST